MGEPDELSVDQASELFSDISDTFNILMGAKQGKLEPPVEIEPGFNGDKAHAMGSARHIAEQIEDAGYTVETTYLGEVEATFGDERHEMRITVED